MGDAPDWDNPGARNWIRAEEATYVHGSARMGGMGAPEVVPFGTPDAARAFASAHGGQTVPYDDIPKTAFLGPVTLIPSEETSQ